MDEQQRDTLLIRLDVRVQHIEEGMKAYQGRFVTKDEFAPVRMLVYGIAAVMLLGVVGTLMKFVFPSMGTMP